MTSLPYSVLPSLPTLFAIGLALLAAYVGKLLSDGDTIARNLGAGARWRKWLVASVQGGSIPEDIGGFLLALLHEIDICRNSRLTVIPVALFYLTADALAYLTTSNGLDPVNQAMFSEWVERYLNPDSGDYRYPANRLFAARCAFLNNQDVQDDSPVMTYDRSGHHIVGHDGEREVKVASVPDLMNDLEISIKRLVEVLQTDQEMLGRTKSRWPITWGLGGLFGLSSRKDLTGPGSLDRGRVRHSI